MELAEAVDGLASELDPPASADIRIKKVESLASHRLQLPERHHGEDAADLAQELQPLRAVLPQPDERALKGLVGSRDPV